MPQQSLGKLAMAKIKNNFTYVIGLEGGAEEGPLSYCDLQPYLKDRRIVGSTFIKRSDRAEWTTAADLPELKVRDVVEGKDPFGPDAVTQEISKELEMRKVRSGVSWMFWIAALSLLNTGLAALGIGASYAMGLGAAHLIAALGDYFGNSAIWISLAANLSLSVAFLVVGVLAWHGRPGLLGPAIVVYVADAILCALFEQWLSVGLHAFALLFLIPGFIASYGARGLELTNRTWATHGAATAILALAGFGAFMFLEKAATAEPAPWAASAPAQWPQISVGNVAEFKKNTPLNAGNAFFVRTKSGNVVAGTARHLIGPAGGVTPTVKLSELDSAITKWELPARAGSAKPAHVVGLHGSSQNYRVLDDWVLLKVSPEDVANLPAEPLSPRLTLVEKDETVYLVGKGVSGTTQEIHPAKVIEADDQSINAKLEKPIDLTGFSGSPVIDKNGNLIGVLTSSRANADKQGNYPSFVAESVLEVAKLLR
jgi:hypothetical protein